jgi:uncharacterized protein YpuA (DUF1002 family)
MKIKKFGELNEGHKPFQAFVDHVKKIVNREPEEGNEPTHLEIEQEVAELIDAYKLTDADLDIIIDEYGDDWDIKNYLKPTIDYDKEQKSKHTSEFNEIKTLLKKNLIGDEEDINQTVKDLLYYFGEK